MQKLLRSSTGTARTGLSVAALVAALALGTLSAAKADETEAKAMVKAMSDYLAAQKVIAFDFDTNLEIVSPDDQKVGLASSGKFTISRPDKVRATRDGGFTNVELVFDGKTLTLLGKNENAYIQVEAPGTIDHLIDELRTKYHRPVPGADLLLSNVYEELMPSVVDVKDLGTGVIGGVECNHFAFRAKEVDWQIWIAQGDRPYPCRYVITSLTPAQPQYTLDIRSWKTGAEVAADDFSFKNPTNAQKVELDRLKDVDELPSSFETKGGK